MSIHSSPLNSARFLTYSRTSTVEIWNGVNSTTLKGRILRACTSVSSYVIRKVPHIPPASSIGYCLTKVSGTLTNCSLMALIEPQYLSSVSTRRTSRLAISVCSRFSRI